MEALCTVFATVLSIENCSKIKNLFKKNGSCQNILQDDNFVVYSFGKHVRNEVPWEGVFLPNITEYSHLYNFLP